jgi:hypothetical protein
MAGTVRKSGAKEASLSERSKAICPAIFVRPRCRRSSSRVTASRQACGLDSNRRRTGSNIVWNMTLASFSASNRHGTACVGDCSVKLENLDTEYRWRLALSRVPRRCHPAPVLPDGSIISSKANLRLSLFRLTRRRIRTPPKPLIPLMPATVHGVVFDIFVLEGTKASG